MTADTLKKHRDFLDRTSDRACPNCGRKRHYTHILWANQFGNAKRRFCDVCGCWWDTRTIYFPEDTNVRIVQPGLQNGDSFT